jgi:hypothetical protein
MLLPLRLAAESLGAKVEWDDRIRAVYIYYEEPAAEEREAAASILKKFFSCLQQGDFAQAAALFEPDPDDINWQCIKGLYPPEKDKEDVLRYYCGNMNKSHYSGNRYLCLLKPEVLCTGKVGDEEYRLSVQFRKEDGSIYIYGPCCGETLPCGPGELNPNDYASGQTVFTYVVRQGSEGSLKVATPPLYRP